MVNEQSKKDVFPLEIETEPLDNTQSKIDVFPPDIDNEVLISDLSKIVASPPETEIRMLDILLPERVTLPPEIAIPFPLPVPMIVLFKTDTSPSVIVRYASFSKELSEIDASPPAIFI